ncbi:LINE-1 reverse transcriptase like, partial [Trifolium medium]|nr:LINE-1 reverse transcriptase like [Trifolium medium]
MVKKSMIRKMVKDEKVEFLAIQVTKLEEVSDALCYNIWGGEDCSWAFYPSVGNSGGILSIWRKSVSSLIFSFTGDGYVGVCLEWGVQKKRCFLVNVYSKCELSNKRRLWESILMSKGGFGGGAWCVIGDFNAVLHRDERRGINFQSPMDVSLESIEFNNFVSNMELLDLPVLGRKFTWFHPNGSSMSMIDRALVGNVDWGPRPFRFNNHWLQNDDFKRLVEDSWREQEVEGWMGFILKGKLKGLKTRIKLWNKEVYGGIDLKIKKLMEDIEELDVRGELGIMNEEDMRQRKHKFRDLWHLWKSKESVLLQRARGRWLR